MPSHNTAPQPVPNQPAAAKPKKPIWKRWWFWLIVVIVVLAIAGSQMSGSDKATTSVSSSTASQQTPSDSGTADSDKQSTEPKQSDKQSEEPQVPADYRSALRQADTYANRMHMSKARLYDQLTSEAGEKFTAEEADYAIQHLNG